MVTRRGTQPVAGSQLTADVGQAASGSLPQAPGFGMSSENDAPFGSEYSFIAVGAAGMIGLDSADTSNWNSFGAVFIWTAPVPSRSVNFCCHGPVLERSRLSVSGPGVNVVGPSGVAGSTCRRTESHGLQVFVMVVGTV